MMPIYINKVKMYIFVDDCLAELIDDEGIFTKQHSSMS